MSLQHTTSNYDNHDANFTTQIASVPVFAINYDLSFDRKIISKVLSGTSVFGKSVSNFLEGPFKFESCK